MRSAFLRRRATSRSLPSTHDLMVVNTDTGEKTSGCSAEAADEAAALAPELRGEDDGDDRGCPNVDGRHGPAAVHRDRSMHRQPGFGYRRARGEDPRDRR